MKNEQNQEHIEQIIAAYRIGLLEGGQQRESEMQAASAANESAREAIAFIHEQINRVLEPSEDGVQLRVIKVCAAAESAIKIYKALGFPPETDVEELLERIKPQSAASALFSPGRLVVVDWPLVRKLEGPSAWDRLPTEPTEAKICREMTYFQYPSDSSPGFIVTAKNSLGVEFSYTVPRRVVRSLGPQVAKEAVNRI